MLQDASRSWEEPEDTGESHVGSWMRAWGGEDVSAELVTGEQGRVGEGLVLALRKAVGSGPTISQDPGLGWSQAGAVNSGYRVTRDVGHRRAWHE